MSPSGTSAMVAPEIPQKFLREKVFRELLLGFFQELLQGIRMRLFKENLLKLLQEYFWRNASEIPVGILQVFFLLGYLRQAMYGWNSPAMLG